MSSYRYMNSSDYRRPPQEGEQTSDELDTGKVYQLETSFDESRIETGVKISEWQAGWNVTNAIQGIYIVSLPFAVLHGGYWAIFLVIFVSYICCFTGKILVASLYEPNEDGEFVRVRDSYAAIAEQAIGKKIGGIMVNIAQIIDLMMICILYVVLCGDLMSSSFFEFGLEQRQWMIISSLFLFPCAFLKNLKFVSTLSCWCTIIHIIINLIVFGYCLLQIENWYWSMVTFTMDFQMFPVTIGIVVFSSMSQIYLPIIEENMIDRSRFRCMLNWTHIAAAAFKALFAFVGFITFGIETQEIITNNLPTRGFKLIFNINLLAKILLSYPLPFYVVADLLEKVFFQTKSIDNNSRSEHSQRFPISNERELTVWAVVLRLLLVVVTLLFAIAIPHFAILMGLIASFTGAMLTFVLPCYFHMNLKWKHLQVYTIVWELFIICFGIACGMIGMFSSYNGLIDLMSFSYE